MYGVNIVVGIRDSSSFSGFFVGSAVDRGGGASAK